MGIKNLVSIADNADEFITAAENELAKKPAAKRAWLNSVDHFLKKHFVGHYQSVYDGKDHKLYGTKKCIGRNRFEISCIKQIRMTYNKTGFYFPAIWGGIECTINRVNNHVFRSV